MIRMKTGSLICAALALMPIVPRVAVAQPSRAQLTEERLNTPAVHAGLFRLRPDGKIAGFFGERGENVGDDLDSVVFMVPCSTMGASASHLPVRALASEVWRLSGRVLALTEGQASVEITWQSIRRSGKDETTPTQSRTLTVNRRERVRLETITIPANGECEERLAALDVAYGAMNEVVAFPKGLDPTTSTRTGSNARVATATVNGATTARVVAAGEPVPTMPVAELWLVHSAAEATDETRNTTSAVGAGVHQFTFTPLLIRTSTGTVTVTVQGALESGRAADGKEQFYFSANRTVTFAPSNRPMRDVTFGVDGSTKVTLPMPGPDEVLSFELPPLTIPGGVTLPDRLSIRVRLSSQPMREMPRR